MGNKARARKKKAAARSREQRAARTCAEERERYAEVIAARKARRSAALAVATAFVKQHLPRPERMDTFRKVMEIDQVKYFSRTEKTTRVQEALWWMSYNCRVCGVGKWYCKCQWDSDGEENESDASWMTDGSEWETDTEDEEQNEGLYTPAEKTTSKSSISPEDATAKQQAAEKRKLFVEGK